MPPFVPSDAYTALLARAAAHAEKARADADAKELEVDLVDISLTVFQERDPEAWAVCVAIALLTSTGNLGGLNVERHPSGSAYLVWADEVEPE